jgi:type I restriction-modification system DNA methylase subunit
MNSETLRHIFKASFDYKTYCNEIVHRLFGCNDVASRPELLDTNAEGDQSYFIGQMDDTEGRLLGFFYTQVAAGSDVRRKRVGLRKLISPYLKYDVDGAIAVFDDGRHWRLSYICDLKEGSTSAKRFSYIMGDEQGQYKTPLERLEKIARLNGHIKLSDLKESFSVDALSDEFFNEYHIHYDRIVAELARQRKSGAVYHDYVKKLMGRIVFLYFLQKKGWLCGDTNFMYNTFLGSNRQNDYLESVLEPLFFGILNTEPAKREQVFVNNGWQQRLVGKWATIPYLNGGLFERDAVDELKIVLPKYLFEDLFRFLASYNFTVDENDPDDAEIGVDPEMLGKIFESLLEDNKAKGAFYTPKEIVRYMCKESLIAHLASKLPDVSDAVIRAFVETHEMQSELESYRDALSTTLREVKICDPAIGSGAFPMGLLNELWRCREALGTQESRLQLKKEIIENNIYGVDIERGAIDIARLRFWLSIVVDSEEPQPLPNFDYKFMQGNSLIESYGGYDLSRIAGKTVGRPSTSTQLVIGLDSDLSRKNLHRLLRDYFSVTDHQKKATMRQAINEEVKTLIRESVGGTTAFLSKLSTLDPSANQEFFLWHTWFKDIFDNGGFDIVIGNPPYFQVKKGIVDKNKFPYSEGKDKGKQNIYKLFVEHSYNILSPNGICALITQSSLMCDSSAQYTRELLLKKTTLFQVIEFPKVASHPEGQLFKGALVATCIVLYRKTIPSKEHVFCLSAHNDLTTLENFDFAQLSQQTPIDFYPEGYCFPLIRRQDFSIIEKMNDGTMFLGKMIQSSSQGDFNLTNESFCFSTKPTDVKMYRGCHVHRYYIDNEVEEFILGGYKNDIVQNNIKNRYIVCQQISGMTDKRRFNVAITKQDRCLFGNSVNKLAIRKDFNLFFILAIINSQVIDWYFRKTSTNNHVNIYELEQLPIPKASLEQQKPIIELISKIMEKKISNSTADVSSLEQEIDRLVYKLYNLTNEEIAVIEAA